MNYQKVHPRSSVVLCQLGTPGSSSYASSSSSILRNGGIVDKLQQCHDFGGGSLYHLRVEPFSQHFYISTLQSLGRELTQGPKYETQTPKPKTCISIEFKKSHLNEGIAQLLAIWRIPPWFCCFFQQMTFLQS